MSRDLNFFTCIGRVTKDPELKYLPSGMQVTNFSLAVNDSCKKNDKWEDYANFFDVTVFGKSGENCASYLKKGSQVAITGSLRQNRWQDKNQQYRSKINIIANTVQFLTPSNKSKNSNTDNIVDNFDGEIQDPWKDENKQDSFNPA